MTAAFRESLASLRFELPTLEECEATYKASRPSKAGLTAECSPGTETTPAQEAGLTAECSRGTETTPAQETGMTVQDVEGCSTKSPSILPIAVVIDCDQRSLSAISTSGHRSLASRSNRFLWDEQQSVPLGRR